MIAGSRTDRGRYLGTPKFFTCFSSQLSLKHAEEARRTVLEFLGAPASTSSDDDDSSDEYTVIFTPNASGALKLVGEAFQFSERSSFVLGVDSHNGVNGIREFARRGGAKVAYVPASIEGAPMTTWCGVDPVARQEGVAACGREPEDVEVDVDEDAWRTSYSVTVRSVDAARAVCPSEFSAISKNGFSDDVMVCVQTPFSISHKRTVESSPQLYAVFSLPTFPNTTRETLAV